MRSGQNRPTGLSMTAGAVFLVLVGLASPLPVVAQTALDAPPSPPKTQARPELKAGAHIVKVYVEQDPKKRPDRTGPVHVLYSDRTEKIEKSGAKYNYPPKIADDQQTAGWEEHYGYPYRLVIAIYRDKKVIYRFEGAVPTYWEFLEGGNLVAIVWMANHGSLKAEYNLYDVTTGKIKSEIIADNNLNPGAIVVNSLRTDAPIWAKKVEEDWGKESP